MRRDDDVIRALVPPRNRPLVYDGRIPPARFRRCEKPLQRLPGHFVSCGSCEPCLERRRYDVVGRLLAESWTSSRAYMITYTIGGDRQFGSTADNPKAQGLHKPDVQAANKRLREYISRDAEHRWVDAGHDPALFQRPSVRYFYVGEFGDRKQRPHYHQILFLQDGSRIPDLVLDRAYFHGKMHESCSRRLYPEVDYVDSDRTYWPFGTTHIKEFHRDDAYYTSTYCVPTVEQRRDEASAWVVMPPGRSVRPLLGAGYFDDLARRTAEQGLPLRDDGYRLPVMDPNYFGASALHHMNRSTKFLLVDRYRTWWKAIHGGDATQQELPRSDFMDRVFAVEDYRKLRVYSEGHKFFQDARRLLEVNQAKAAEAVADILGGAYAAVRSGTRIWG